MIEYTWKVGRLSCIPKINENINIVSVVEWTASATNEKFTVTNHYVTSINIDENSEFLPFTQLSEEIIFNWIWATGVDKQLIQEDLAKQINDLVNPPLVFLQPPWEQLP